MINRIEEIRKALNACDNRCRKCVWRDGFSGECTLFVAAANYIEMLEIDNATEKIYCKDCVYCKKTTATHRYERDRYECKHKDGLPSLPDISPMDYCSRGRKKDE